MLTSQLHLAPRLQVRGAVASLPQYAFMASTATSLLLSLIIIYSDFSLVTSLTKQKFCDLVSVWYWTWQPHCPCYQLHDSSATSQFDVRSGRVQHCAATVCCVAAMALLQQFITLNKFDCQVEHNTQAVNGWATWPSSRPWQIMAASIKQSGS